MIATKELIAEAKQLAHDNYESWGQYIVECYEDSELAESLEDFDSLDVATPHRRMIQYNQ